MSDGACTVAEARRMEAPVDAGHEEASRPRRGGENEQGGSRVEVVVRQALPGDRAPLEFFLDTALRRDYFMRRGQLAEILADRRHRVYIAEIDAVLVGVAVTTRGSRLINALVHPAYRGLGVGRSLLAGSGANEVRAKIDMSTGDPRGFYRKAGFESTGEFNAKGNVEVMRRAGS